MFLNICNNKAALLYILNLKYIILNVKSNYTLQL